MAERTKSQLGEVMQTVYVVNTGEYSERTPYVICANEEVAKGIDRLTSPDPEFEGTPIDTGHAEPVVMWKGEGMPPHHTLYKVECWLQGPISQHNLHAKLDVFYSTEVHWPWDCYAGYPAVADIQWPPEARDTEAIRDNLEKLRGVSLPIYVIEGYDHSAVVAAHQKHIEGQRARYSQANILWSASPRERQVRDSGSPWRDPEPSTPTPGGDTP